MAALSFEFHRPAVRSFAPLLRLGLLPLAAGLLSSCALVEDYREHRERKATEARLAAERAAAVTVHSEWRSTTKGWRSKTFRNEAVIAKATAENVSLEIALSEQRGLLLVDGVVAMDYPVATGKRSHPTPKGDYRIKAKQKDYSSNLYGKIVDAAGTVLVEDADTRQHAVPEGATFAGAKMPYWMRLTDTGVGLHVGYVPGRPASHGCIRLKRAVAEELFSLTKIGTPVVIADTAPALATETVKKP
jgi:hypothetical protein